MMAPDGVLEAMRAPSPRQSMTEPASATVRRQT
eukprot:CAMPEP_0183366530 /NCGR_PEP_ID=MMETSP0164_2-20130417/88994_1 /TAXON_ID=221442 /ORGANISM="Coccolithus pelagicus ssp braarudi, Strain PLY182g" /LENGTH=32 /DNA_ID= /DNA_START= /DNA_END= /DNA_ORIENTATION=